MPIIQSLLGTSKNTTTPVQGFFYFNGSLTNWDIHTTPLPPNYIQGSVFPDGTIDNYNNFTGSQNILSPFLGTFNYITINLWIYPTSNGKVVLAMLGQQQENVAWNASILEINNSGYLLAGVWDQHNSTGPITSTNKVILNAWNHVYFYNDGTNSHLELNGVASPSIPFVGSYPGSAVIAIGAYELTAFSVNNRYEGRLGELRINNTFVPSNYSLTKHHYQTQTLLSLDANDVGSYPGSGSIWSDISNSNGLVVKVYSPTYGSANSESQMNSVITNSTYLTSFISPDVNNLSYSTYAQSNKEYYALQAEGYITLPLTGTYWFGVDSDDASDFYFDGELVAWWYSAHGGNNNGTPGGSRNPVTRNAGTYPIKARLQEFSGGDFITLYYSTDNVIWNVVPNSWFTHGPNDVTLYNSPTFNNTSPKYLSFNNNDLQYGLAPNIGDVHRWTIETWFKLDSSLPNGGECILTNTYDAGVINYTIGNINSASTISVGFFDGSWRITNGFTPSIGNWYHVVGTYDGSLIKQYLNGSLLNTYSYIGKPSANGSTIRIARRWDLNSSSNFFPGSIGLIKIHLGAMSSGEVYDSFQSTRNTYGV